MQVVDHAVLWNPMCLVRKTSDGPMVDLLRDYDPDNQGRIYISVAAVADLAKACDFPTPEEHAEALERIADLEDQLAVASDRVAELEEFEESATWTLKHLDSNVKRKPGRKPQEKAA